MPSAFSAMARRAGTQTTISISGPMRQTPCMRWKSRPPADEPAGATCTAAYETLDADLRARIQGLTIKHDETYNAAGMLRRGYELEDDIRISPGPHPIVRTHPETGHNFLYLGRRVRAYVNGLELSQSEELLDALWAYAEKSEFQWMHDWRGGGGRSHSVGQSLHHTPSRGVPVRLAAHHAQDPDGRRPTGVKAIGQRAWRPSARQPRPHMNPA